MILLNVIGIIFVILKLAGYIDWSWWLVLLPFAPLILAVLLWVAAAAMLLVGILLGLIGR